MSANEQRETAVKVYNWIHFTQFDFKLFLYLHLDPQWLSGMVCTFMQGLPDHVKCLLRALTWTNELSIDKLLV